MSTQSHEPDTAIARSESTALAARSELSIEEVTAQVGKIQQVMAAVMRDGEHYGVIPGTNKPTLYKPGAEKLLLTFRLGPRYSSEKTWHDDGHLTVVTMCELVHIPTNEFIAAGEGLCTTKESKYAYRNPERTCPTCGAAAIIKGKAEYGGGWVCWQRKGGCGAKFAAGDDEIEGQDSGKVANPDLADSYNTVLKMAAKRALVAAVLNGTAASDLFTQDLEDATGDAVSADDSPAAEVMASDAQIAELQALCDATGHAPAKIAEAWGVEALTDLTATRAEQSIARLREIQSGGGEDAAAETSEAVAESDEATHAPRGPAAASEPSEADDGADLWDGDGDEPAGDPPSGA